MVLYEPIPLLSEAISLFLATQPDIDAVGFDDLAEFMMSVAAAVRVILSIYGWGPHVAATIGRIREASPARIALLGVDNHPNTAALALAGGADGYIHKRAEPTAFLAAVRGIARGETIFVLAEDADLGTVTWMATAMDEVVAVR